MAVSVVLVRILAEACERVGVSEVSLLQRARFDERRFGETDARVSLDDYARVLDTAISDTADPALGLHIGERSNFPGFEVTSGLIAFAENLRASLQTYLRFQRMFGEEHGSELTESGDTATLRFEFSRGGAVYNRFRAELSMVCFFRLIAHATCGEGRLSAVCFEHERPPYGDEYHRIFGGVERFEQPFTSIAFPRSLLDRAPAPSDPEFRTTLEGVAQRRLARLERGTTTRAQVAERLKLMAHRGTWPSLPEVARQLGTSERSLRRRLTAENTTFGELRNDAFSELAKNYLSDSTRSIADAAFSLGFSDTTSFHRAFKRWTGLTPKQFRGLL